MFDANLSKVKIWLKELRLPFLTVVIMPVLLGSILAWKLNDFLNWALFLLTLLSSIFAALGAHILNDYFDHLSGADEMNKDFVRPFTGGSRIIQEGLLKPREVYLGGIICLSISGAIIIYLTFVKGWVIMLLGGSGIFLAYYYTSPPMKLSYRGLGEIAIGVSYGPLLVLLAFYVQAGLIIGEIFFLSLIPGILTMLVILINEFPDYQGDKESGKRNLVVKLGKKLAARLYIFFLFLVYLLSIMSIFFSSIGWGSLLVLFTIPLGLIISRIILSTYNDPKKISPACALTIINNLLITSLLIISYLFFL